MLVTRSTEKIFTLISTEIISYYMLRDHIQGDNHLGYHMCKLNNNSSGSSLKAITLYFKCKTKTSSL